MIQTFENLVIVNLEFRRGKIPKNKNHRERPDEQIVPNNKVKTGKSEKPGRDKKPAPQSENNPMIPFYHLSESIWSITNLTCSKGKAPGITVDSPVLLFMTTE